MSRSVLTLLIAAVFLTLLAPFGAAQANEKPTNLQVLPKDISHDDLIQTMRGFAISLGVRCEHCHAEKGHDMDFASDMKPEKEIARTMMKMAGTINHDYIDKLGIESPVKVQCVTCHRGLARPITINALMMETMQKKDTAAAVAQYRELRQKYYGSASYDFSDMPLNLLSESLIKANKPKDALAFVQVNMEFNNPPSALTYRNLVLAERANGDTEKAKADLQKMSQAFPEDHWVKQQMEPKK